MGNEDVGCDFSVLMSATRDVNSKKEQSEPKRARQKIPFQYVVMKRIFSFSLLLGRTVRTGSFFECRSECVHILTDGIYASEFTSM